MNLSKHNETQTLLIPVLVLLFAGFTACSDISETQTTTPQVRLNTVVTTSGVQNGVSQANLSTGTTTHVELTEAKFLVREIEFESALDQDSLDFVTEPMVLNLNLAGEVIEVAIADLEPGVYNEIEFDVHKPEDNETPPDPEFRIGDSGDERFSIILKGTVNGNDFVFRSRENFDIELAFPSNITIDENNTAVDVTLRIDISGWFIDENGNELDPSNFDHVAQIEDNIENSFEAFEDDDRDGEVD